MKVGYWKYSMFCCLVILIAIGSVSFDNKTDDIRFVIPKDWPKPVYNFSKNKLTQAGFELGRKLFYDPILSRDGTISCASCHAQWSGFTHGDHGLSHGIEGRKGKRNSLTLFNLAWNKSFMWDGGVNHLEVQPLAPITNNAEMGNTLEQVVKTLDTAKGYRARFYEAFGDSTITGQHVLKAIAQFLVMFESFNSRYDKYVRKEPGGEMTEKELSGLRLFRQNCESCHKEPLFTNYEFENIGLAPDDSLKDYGRMTITGDPGDSLKFRVPSLRNIMVSYPYMHDGRFNTLLQVMDHYTDGIIAGPTLANELKTPMILTLQDKQDIIVFLKTLTDKEFLIDSRLREVRE